MNARSREYSPWNAPSTYPIASAPRSEEDPRIRVTFRPSGVGLRLLRMVLKHEAIASRHEVHLPVRYCSHHLAVRQPGDLSGLLNYDFAEPQ